MGNLFSFIRIDWCGTKKIYKYKNKNKNKKIYPIHVMTPLYMNYPIHITPLIKSGEIDFSGFDKNHPYFVNVVQTPIIEYTTEPIIYTSSTKQ